MPDTTSREERLAEVTRLSRKPMQKLHADLLGLVMGAMDRLTEDDLLAIAKKLPDRLIQGLSQTARLAGYSDKHELEMRGSLDLYEQISTMSDSELEALREQRHREEAPAMFTRIADALPPALAQQLRGLSEDAKERVYAAMAAPEWR